MNLVLLFTIIFCCAVVHGQLDEVQDKNDTLVSPLANPQPCLWNPNNNAYNQFAQRHILQRCFNVKSRYQWSCYLRSQNLCHRPVQSFIRSKDQGRVTRICNGYGRRLSPCSGNLCISTSRILVYDLLVNCATCQVTSLRKSKQYVIVACDKVANRCLPVHYQRNCGQRPNRCAQVCRP